jgi:hypothetical protein
MSAPKKQTAVEWLVEQIQLGKIEIIYSNEIHSIKCIPKIIDQANAMFEQQIKDAWKHGNIPTFLGRVLTAEQYYKETYD